MIPKLQLVDGTHPVVHPASGSHANFYESSLYLGTSAEQGFGCDDTRNAGDRLRPVVRLIPSDALSARAAFPWITYQGHWGQREESFYNGPTGPNTKSSWAAPVTFQQQHGREGSFAVPAGGLLGTGATDFFCGAVADGSDILRQIVDNPGRSLLVLGLLAVLVVFLARRTTWQPSAPRRVPRRRATGQIILASARMYASHRVVFIGIGIVIVPRLARGLGRAGSGRAAAGSVPPGGEEGTVLALLAGLLGYLLLGIATVLVLAATMAALMEIDAERRVGVGRAYRLALARWRPLVVAFLTASLVLAVLSVTIVLAPVALVLAVLWALFVAVVQLEGSSGRGALRRSAQLVRHQIVRIAFLLLVSTLLASVIGAVLGTLVILLTGAPFWLANAVAGITYAVLLPYVGLTMAYAYFDSRVTIVMGSRGAPEEVLAAELPEPS